ncbi:MAG: hypothetical protein IT355_12240 [Gemmatimonadaceae bacterium]|nr:hypothetical protein [Gemmatimonadaceae bacterium]
MAREQAQAARAEAQEQAQAVRAEAQEQAQAAREQAQAAREEAQAARESAREGQADGASDAVVTITKDGQTITLKGASPEAVATALGMPLPEQREESDGPYVVGALAILSTAAVVLAAVTMWYRTRMRTLSGGATPMPAELTQRMARMETAIESVAIEVERISEGQRFTTRLLSDRSPVEVPRG